MDRVASFRGIPFVVEVDPLEESRYSVAADYWEPDGRHCVESLYFDWDAVDNEEGSVLYVVAVFDSDSKCVCDTLDERVYGEVVEEEGEIQGAVAFASDFFAEVSRWFDENGFVVASERIDAAKSRFVEDIKQELENKF